MVVGLLAMLFVIVSAYITLARVERVMQRDLRAGGRIDQMLSGIHDLTASLVRQQLADSGGHVMRSTWNPSGVGPIDTFSQSDIIGSGPSRLQGSIDPFFDYRLLNTGLKSLRQFVTSVGAHDGTTAVIPVGTPLAPGVAIGDLVATQSFGSLGGTPPRRLLNGTADPADYAQLARRSFMDADGDGIPDSSFEHLISLQEMVNAIGGRSVRAPLINMNSLNAAAWSQWQRFNNLAQYEIALRVVPHGGMVSLDSPEPLLPGTSGGPFNREFVKRMFEWVRHPNDNADLKLNDFKNLPYHQDEIEPIIRRRGGMLPPFGDLPDNSGVPRIPDLLRNFEKVHPNTFLATFGRKKEQIWQRFNLSLPQERGDTGGAGWLNGVQLDPTTLSTASLRAYGRRHLITYVSFSDNLARKQSTDGATGAIDWFSKLGTHQGQLRFQLNRITQVNSANQGAFILQNGQWRFNVNPANGNGPARLIIKEIADLFYDMLAGHDFDDQETVLGIGAGPDIGRRRQALMLAVNTVAFATPRNADGSMDVVFYEDLDLGGPGPVDDFYRTYVGYAPQPFFSEAQLHYERSTKAVALALELHNPNEPTPVGIDLQALNLQRFAVGFNGFDPNSGVGRNTDWFVLADVLGAPRLDGRTVKTLEIRETADTTIFTSLVDGSFELTGGDQIPINREAGKPAALTLNIWRQALGVNGRWYMVDEINVSHGDLPADDAEWWSTRHRDTTDDGLHLPIGGVTARWGVAVGSDYDEEDEGVSGEDKEPETNTLGNLDMPIGQPLRFVPSPPLYTMNATPATQSDKAVPIHGSVRPRSFPTVGFMLFVPRYSHVAPGIVGVPKSGPTPMTTLLNDEWDLFKSERGWDETNYAADFAHIPVFDNRQDANANGPFAEVRDGKIPWGQLVFDYFTTIDKANIPRDDPLRIPGRININAAPWYVLAGLPVLSRSAVGTLVDIHGSASPAFWSAGAGVMVDAAQQRYNPADLGIIASGLGSWQRLGLSLGVSLASYRDRAAYVPPLDTNFFARGAFGRNKPSEGFIFRDEGTYGEIRRELGPTASRFGLLSLGELANVKGFDAATYGGVGNYGGLSETLVATRDFVKAVTVLALLDTQFLTTRSNTFTVYTSITDRENPAASVRSQVTIDRSNTLPRLTFIDADNDNFAETPVTIESSALPRVIGQRQIGYFNAAFDD